MPVKLSETLENVRNQVDTILDKETVASPDHVKRVTGWCQRWVSSADVDAEAVLAGALVHDVGVTVDRKTHFTAGRPLAEKILKKAGLPEEKIPAALHGMECHSHYGGPDPQTSEARLVRDADAMEYLGAIGLVRAVVRGLADGSFDGRAESFPKLLNSLLGKLEKTVKGHQYPELAEARLNFMREFKKRMERELDFEA